MSKLLFVQEYLLSGKTLEDLRIEHGVNSYICNGKIGLTYDMIEAKESNILAQQCRGLVLRKDNFDIIACPLFRFFNLEQKSVIPENFDWSSAVFEEKVDGSLITTYWDNILNKWCCGTRSRPEADGNIDGSALTFAILVDIAIQSMKNKAYPKELDINNILFNTQYYLQDLMNSFPLEAKDYTFVFELTSPFNRIVCKYDNISLTLLFVRNNKTLQEDIPENWVNYGSEFGLKTPKTYNFKNVNHMVQVIKEWNPEEHEGIVVKDKHFNRIKVKNPSYVALNHMRDSLSTSFRGCVEVIFLGKDDDIVNMMPEMIADRIRKLKPLIQEVFSITEKDFSQLKHIENMKEYALEAQKCLWPAALFALKRNKTPDLKTFAMGNMKTSDLKIPQTALDTMLDLCRKLDSTFDDFKSVY